MHTTIGWILPLCFKCTNALSQTDCYTNKRFYSIIHSYHSHYNLCSSQFNILSVTQYHIAPNSLGQTFWITQKSWKFSYSTLKYKAWHYRITKWWWITRICKDYVTIRPWRLGTSYYVCRYAMLTVAKYLSAVHFCMSAPKLTSTASGI